jgi:carboxypeptidase C (cathepsin A)
MNREDRRVHLRWAAAALIAGVAATCVAAPPAANAPAQRIAVEPSTTPFEEPTVVCPKQIVVDGRPLYYTAETGRVAIRDVATGEVHGRIFYVAYRATGVPGPRPLLFIWNGGPGANSALLHFEAAGPKRLAGATLVDNAETWLTHADLVFVDPVGTGFSRPERPEYAAEFYGTVGDVASVTEFVRAWRVLHAAEDAPLFLAGESWGAGRAGSVGYALLARGIHVDGLVMISGGAGLNASDASADLLAALRVVDWSSTSLHHGRLAVDLGTDAATIRSAAERWARDTYAPALGRAAALDPTERAAVLGGLQRYTGLPTAALDAQSLRVFVPQYRESLLRDRGQKLFTFDMRLTAVPPAAAPATVLRYLRIELGYRTSLPYLGLDELKLGYAPGGQAPPSVNERWDYATTPLSAEQRQAAFAEAVKRGDGPPQLGPPLPSTAEAVALNPGLRVLVAAGRFDSLSSCTANNELARRLPAALAVALEFRCYDGGHMLYRDAAARRAFARDVRALLEGRSAR